MLGVFTSFSFIMQNDIAALVCEDDGDTETEHKTQITDSY